MLFPGSTAHSAGQLPGKTDLGRGNPWRTYGGNRSLLRQQYVHFISDHDSCCKGSQCQNHRKADLHHTGSDAAVNRGHVTDRYHTGLYL